MIEQSPYDKLGVTEEATFDEIQEARTRLVQECSDDPELLEAVEAAYDAILMERLRLRQEGKIKVPEGIRFAENLTQLPPKEKLAPVPKSPSWLQGLRDTPSSREILLPGIAFLGLSCIGVFSTAAGTQILQLVLVAGVGFSLYFLNRKERKFGRAVLLTVIGLITGLIGGGVLGGLLQLQIASIHLTVEQFSTLLTFILLWLIDSFLR